MDRAEYEAATIAAAARSAVGRLLTSRFSAELLAQIPSGSRYLGAGTEAVALMTPAGDVVRIGLLIDGRASVRANIPEVLQATSDVRIGPDWIAERLPYAPHDGITAADVATLAERIAGRGYDLRDAQPENLGRLSDGSIVVTDAGSVRPDATLELARVTKTAVEMSEPGRCYAGEVFDIRTARVYQCAGRDLTIAHRRSAFGNRSIGMMWKRNVSIAIAHDGRASIRMLPDDPDTVPPVA